MGNFLTKQHVKGQMTVPSSGLELSIHEQFGHIIHKPYNGTLAPVFPFLDDSDINNLGCPNSAFDLNTDTSALPLPPTDFVALFQRGQCSPIVKALQAQRMNAIAVIIGDNTLTADDYDTSDDDDNKAKGVKIPVYSISGSEYIDLLDAFPKATISEGIAVEMRPGKTAVIGENVSLVVFACIIGLALITLPLCACRSSAAIARRKAQGDAEAALAAQTEEMDAAEMKPAECDTPGAGDLPMYEASRAV